MRNHSSTVIRLWVSHCKRDGREESNRPSPGRTFSGWVYPVHIGLNDQVSLLGFTCLGGMGMDLDLKPVFRFINFSQGDSLGWVDQFKLQL